MSTVVIVTGASSGMGEATARRLSTAGWRVFGGDLRPGPGVRELDIRSDASVAAFVGGVLQETGRIDALLNIAGFALAGAVEETSLEEARGQLDTNFFGLVRMVRAVLPVMRAQKAGRIVNVSSGAALAAGPFHAFYTASKWAVEGFTEALAHEVRPFGVHASVLQPGSFRTNVVRNSRVVESPMPEYDAPRGRVIRAMADYTAKAPPPDAVARAMERILAAKRPRLRYRVGKDVKSSYWARWLLPEGTYHRMVGDWYDV